MEQDLYFPYVIGVSAGACHAASYLSRQRNRNKTVNIDYASHPKYLSYKTYGENVSYLIWILFFMKFQKSMCRLILKHTLIAQSVFFVGTTDCETGQSVYFEKEGTNDDALNLLQASSSLPFIAPVVNYRGKQLLDGGISDPIPVRKAQEDGFKNQS